MFNILRVITVHMCLQAVSVLEYGVWHFDFV